MPQQPAKNNRARFIFVATGFVAVLVLAGFLADRKWHWLTGGPQYETPALDPDYLPPDAGALLRVNLREAQHSKLVNKEFGSLLQVFRENVVPHDTQAALGADVARDVEWMQLTATAKGMDHPL